jgi:hypothetical protein
MPFSSSPPYGVSFGDNSVSFGDNSVSFGDEEDIKEGLFKIELIISNNV